MKKIILGLILLIGGNLYAADNLYQDYGSYFDINTSTNIIETISSGAPTTSNAVLNGIHRIFKIKGTSSNSMFIQQGGSTSTVLTNGMELLDSVYYVEDTFFGDIHFQTNAGTIDLSIHTLTK